MRKILGLLFTALIAASFCEGAAAQLAKKPKGGMVILNEGTTECKVNGAGTKQECEVMVIVSESTNAADCTATVTVSDILVKKSGMSAKIVWKLDEPGLKGKYRFHGAEGIQISDDPCNQIDYKRKDGKKKFWVIDLNDKYGLQCQMSYHPNVFRDGDGKKCEWKDPKITNEG